MKSVAIDMTGQRFGRLTVESRVGTIGKKATWLCRCDCGNSATILGDSLRRENTRSCGCLRRDEAVANGIARIAHGHCAGDSMSPTYRTWRAMITRCTNQKHVHYARYGGRGVTVCERWMNFDNFLEDMGERPVGRTIDRINSNLLIDGYSKANCRWATATEQNRNSSKLTQDLVQEIHGRCEHGELQRSVAIRLGVSVSTIRNVRKGRTWGEPRPAYARHRR